MGRRGAQTPAAPTRSRTLGETMAATGRPPIVPVTRPAALIRSVPRAAGAPVIARGLPGPIVPLNDTPGTKV